MNRDRKDDEQIAGTDKSGLQKFNEIRLKSKQNTPKLCTDQIQHATNLSPRNHCLGLTHTPGKSDRRKSEKWGKKKNENHSFKYKPQRAKEGFGPSFRLQNTRITP
jgi:hypothetical protein